MSIDGTPPARRPTPLKKTLVHAFVLFHVFAICAWSFTSNESREPLHRAVRRLLGGYMVPMGLTQGWTMFAPNPMSNAYVEAEVTFTDGRRETWPFPRMERLGYFERYRRERLRKWATERLWSGKTNLVLARAAARFAARQVGGREKGVPSRVDLVLYTRATPPPASRRLPRRIPPSVPWERRTIFACELDDGGNVSRILETGEPSPSDATLDPAPPARKHEGGAP